MQPGDKLYVVVDARLTPGQKMAQAIHAFREFIDYYPDLEAEWYRDSNYICVLEAPTEAHIMDLCNLANESGIRFAYFEEPHYRDTLWVTAAAFEPGQLTSNFLQHLPLAGKPS